MSKKLTRRDLRKIIFESAGILHEEEDQNPPVGEPTNYEDAITLDGRTAALIAGKIKMGLQMQIRSESLPPVSGSTRVLVYVADENTLEISLLDDDLGYGIDKKEVEKLVQRTVKMEDMKKRAESTPYGVSMKVGNTYRIKIVFQDLGRKS